MSAIQQKQVDIFNSFGLNDLDDRTAAAINGGADTFAAASSQRIEDGFIITVFTSEGTDFEGRTIQTSSKSIEPIDAFI